MSRIFYGDGDFKVELPYAHTSEFTQTVKYDDSKTDWYCTEYNIKVQCLINSNYLTLLAPDLIGRTLNPAAIMNTIKSRLMKPRQTLSYLVNGVDLIPKNQTGNLGTVDAQNGPQPQSFTFTEITNETFICTYHIVARYWDNISPKKKGLVEKNLPGNTVLYNRWTETADIDTYNRTKWTREGKYLIRSDNTGGFLADQLRISMAVVGVRDRFLRTSARYAVSKDGLGISYTLVDEEQFKMPPIPAFTASGSYKESISNYGAKRHIEVSVTLAGSNRDPQTELIRAAIYVANNKALNRLRTIGKTVIPESASLDMQLYKNEVTFIIKCWVGQDIAQIKVRPARPTGGLFDVPGPPGADELRRVQQEQVVADLQNQARNPIAAFFGILGFLPGTDDRTQPLQPPLYLVYGTARILLQAAAYYDPSLTENVINAVTGQMQLGLAVGEAGKKKEV